MLLNVLPNKREVVVFDFITSRLTQLIHRRALDSFQIHKASECPDCWAETLIPNVQIIKQRMYYFFTLLLYDEKNFICNGCIPLCLISSHFSIYCSYLFNQEQILTTQSWIIKHSKLFNKAKHKRGFHTRPTTARCGFSL